MKNPEEFKSACCGGDYGWFPNGGAGCFRCLQCGNECKRTRKFAPYPADTSAPENRSRHWNTMVNILDKNFPKGKCKERGNALVMLADIEMMLNGTKFDENGEFIETTSPVPSGAEWDWKEWKDNFCQHISDWSYFSAAEELEKVKNQIEAAAEERGYVDGYRAAAKYCKDKVIELLKEDK